MHATQQLLKKQHPNVNWWSLCCSPWAPLTSKRIVNLNLGGNHWITVSTYNRMSTSSDASLWQLVLSTAIVCEEDNCWSAPDREKKHCYWTHEHTTSKGWWWLWLTCHCCCHITVPWKGCCWLYDCEQGLMRSPLCKAFEIQTLVILIYKVLVAFCSRDPISSVKYDADHVFKVSCKLEVVLLEVEAWITSLWVMWTDGWVRSECTQDSQKVCIKLFSLW